MLLHLGLRGFKETDSNSCSQEGGEGGCDYGRNLEKKSFNFSSFYTIV